MSRNPKPRNADVDASAAAAAGMIAHLEAPVPPRVDRPSRSYVEGRGEGFVAGPSATSAYQLGDQARPGQHPRFTEELRSGVNLGTPTGEEARPSAVHGSISYEQRQARARRGR
jgi:hypothetical protein